MQNKKKKKKKKPYARIVLIGCKGKKCGSYWEGEPEGITRQNIRLAA